MFAAGETSGDVNAALLARKLKKIRPTWELIAMGGEALEKAGVRILHDPTAEAVLGFLEGLKALPRMKKLLGEMEKALLQEQPDCLILVDFPGFNMRLGKIAARLGIPVVYYFAPSAWIWGQGRAGDVAKFSRLVLSVFPGEAAVYREAKANVAFIGHPLVDQVQADPEVFREKRGIAPETPLIALLPGSRPQELKELLPELLAAAVLVKEELPQAHFAIAAATKAQGQEARGLAQDLPLEVVVGETYQLLAAADAAAIAMGTAMLEAALLGTPMVGLYRINYLTELITRTLVKTPYFSLPNLLLGKALVPELLQREAKGERIAEELVQLLGEEGKGMQAELLSLRAKLGSGGAVERGAKAVIALLEGGEGAADFTHSQ